MENTRKITPFVREERRLMKEFSAEINKFGLRIANGCSGHYLSDEVYELFLNTEPYPLAGNKELVKALEEAGYSVSVYAPYNWDKRRAFMVTKSYRINLTELNEEG